MRYGSVCSGIEAATSAWHPLGWTPAFFAEIEPFPCAVLKHHYPNVPNFGDMTRFKEWPDAAIDVLVGGTPCQSFSVAGLRGGLDDPRGNLMLTYVAIARKYRPKRVVWENVPGVLSSNGGRDFASLLAVLSGRAIVVPADGWQNGGIVPGIEGAYGLAWRVLDAQYCGVPQRRRRVFVVGCLGDWRGAAAVRFERASLRGDPAPRRQARQGVAGSLTASASRRRGSGQQPESLVGGVAPPLLAQGNSTGGDRPPGTTVDTAESLIVMSSGQANAEINTDGSAPALTCLHEAPIVTHPFTLAIRGRGDGRELEYRQDGTANAILTPNGGRDGMNVGAIAFDTTQITSPANGSNPQPGDPSHTLSSSAKPPAVAFKASHYTRDKDGAPSEVTPPLSADADKGDQDTLIAIPINADALRGEGSAKTPSPDAAGVVRLRDPGFGVGNDGDPAGTLSAAGPGAVAVNFEHGLAPHGSLQVSETMPALTGSEYKGHTAVAVNISNGEPRLDDVMATLDSARESRGANQQRAVLQPVAFEPRYYTRDNKTGGQPSDTAVLKADAAKAGDSAPHVATAMQVRRLTPMECERLQGFADNFTLIEIRGKPAADGPRYKALGNSMAVPVMRWIGTRIQAVEAIRERTQNWDDVR